MPNIDDRFPKSGFFSARDWDEAGDLTLQIAYVAYDETIGFDKTADVVHFANDGRQLALNQTTARAIAKLHGKEMDGWRDKWITLYLDLDVEYQGKKTGGIRVREATAGNGNAVIVPASPPKTRAADLEDEIPF
jgi:hypothetical protein